ncbi:MAG: response regulator, partial [Bryobacteraceae bacterium]|nr:response regulator [Bryobacteraceae bacterium]
NMINQKVVLSLLTKRGYSVEVANNGVEAMEALKRAGYDIVLMDIQMPLLDGLETTRRIRSDPRYDGLPVIAMTAHAMNGDKERCLAAGMDGYIAKPVDHKHLLNVIEHYLTGSRTGLAALRRASRTGGAGSEPALVGQMLSLFLQLAPERLKRMAAAADAGDAEALIQDAAKLQSAAESIEAAALAGYAKAIIGAAAEHDFERATLSLAQLEREVNRLSGGVQLPAARS